MTQMNKIIAKEKLAPQITKMVLQAKQVARKILPGQFIVLIVDQKGERIPLTVVEADREKGTITLIFQEIGKSTCKLSRLKVGAKVAHLLGPLGHPSEIRKLGRVVLVAGGAGIAEIYPVARAFKQKGNQTIVVIGARNEKLLFLEKKLRSASDQLLITTDDGSAGIKGLVTDALRQILSSQKLDLAYAVGPVAMMRRVCEITKDYALKTIVSLNPIMVDATGMCGSCRVTVGGKTLFGCVDGPEFDGHLVDFSELEKRLQLFLNQEKEAGECCRVR